MDYRKTVILSESGRVEALLKLKDPSKKNKDKENFSILYLDNHIAKRTIGCPLNAFL